MVVTEPSGNKANLALFLSNFVPIMISVMIDTRIQLAETDPSPDDGHCGRNRGEKRECILLKYNTSSRASEEETEMISSTCTVPVKMVVPVSVCRR